MVRVRIVPRCCRDTIATGEAVQAPRTTVAPSAGMRELCCVGGIRVGDRPQYRVHRDVRERIATKAVKAVIPVFSIQKQRRPCALTQGLDFLGSPTWARTRDRRSQSLHLDSSQDGGSGRERHRAARWSAIGAGVDTQEATKALTLGIGRRQIRSSRPSSHQGAPDDGGERRNKDLADEGAKARRARGT